MLMNAPPSISGKNSSAMLDQFDWFFEWFTYFCRLHFARKFQPSNGAEDAANESAVAAGNAFADAAAAIAAVEDVEVDFFLLLLLLFSPPMMSSTSVAPLSVASRCCC